ncbi:hypothetical protein [Acinetobacter sp. CFCC 10889]|uniref:hypothetical protein n=1 Tax=Acinetobacter sp. CFCC 10889 TaxID=1775557 RepID=UPI000DCFF786|nr:hypothetical protein [Acinetobacter sp. CFCC 10889]
MTDENQNTDTQNTSTDETTQTSLLGGQSDQDQGNNDQSQTETNTTSTVPESIDGYNVEVEGFDFEEFKAIEENQAFLERAREAGLSNESLNFLLKEYNDIIPGLMEANAHLDNEACVQAMTDVWGNETQANFGFAQAAANNAIQNGILTAEEVNSAAFGNNPAVLKAMAYFGQQLGEDLPPQNTQANTATNLSELMSSEAYLDSSHPDHKRVAAQIEAYYAKSYKD